MGQPAKVTPRLETEVHGRLTEAERQSFRRVEWQERMGSLWAPVSVFGLWFALYVIVVEFHTAAFVWARPIMQAVALLCVAAFFGLAIARVVLRRFARTRKARHAARDLLAELDEVLRRNAARIESRVREELVQGATDLRRAYLQPQPEAIEQQTQKLSGAIDKHLAKLRKTSHVEFGLGFVKALAIALLIRTVVVEPFKIPSGSMIPTLEIGDQIFVNKFIYGVRIPFMNKVPFVLVRAPKRGDVIVFNNPVDPDKDFVKRVVGIPGDSIRIIGDVLTINGVEQSVEQVTPDYVYFNQDGSSWFGEGAVLYRELLDGVAHPILQSAERGHPAFNRGQPFVVPEAQVFVLGDNRDNSSDSRFGLGTAPPGMERLTFVPYGNIKGKAMVVWMALGYDGVFSSLFGGTGLRTDRLFVPVR